MVPFIETITSQMDLVAACKKGYDDFTLGKISKNDFFIYFGFTHAEAIIKFYGEIAKDQEKLFVDAGFKSGSSAYFSAGINAWKNLKAGKYVFPPFHTIISLPTEEKKCPLQQIFYGAPGTGKSHKVKNITETAYPNEEERDEFVFRTTFHPDYDYASFVGCYKPKKENDKITYSFVPQVFTNAYVKAWNAFALQNSPNGFSFQYANTIYKIDSVESDQVKVITERTIMCNDVEKRWKARMESGSFAWPANNISSDTQIDSLCKWISDNLKWNREQLPEDWWNKLLGEVKDGIQCTGKQDDTKYNVYQRNGSLLLSTKISYKKDKLKEYYQDGSKSDTETFRKIANELVALNNENFDDAWEKLKTRIDSSDLTNTVKPVYLVIEEINRGNCAQIFGDLFQLLDRKDNGYSEYPIDIDEDLKDYLIQELGPDSDGVKDGKMCLPPNLNLLATMNTSDQSLFPIDSAFKRRWDWEYVPIRYSEDEARDANDKFHEFKIEIGGEQYLWVDFLKKVNEKILAVTDSEDKQMGEYFIKKDVDEKTFINKVMYYLWSEVGKDLYNSSQPFFVFSDGTKDSDGKDKKEFSFNELFRDNATALLKGFMKNLEVESLKSAESPKEEETMATPAE